MLQDFEHEDIQALQDVCESGHFPGARVHQPQEELLDELTQGHQRDSQSQPGQFKSLPHHMIMINMPQ